MATINSSVQSAVAGKQSLASDRDAKTPARSGGALFNQALAHVQDAANPGLQKSIGTSVPAAVAMADEHASETAVPADILDTAVIESILGADRKQWGSNNIGQIVLAQNLFGKTDLDAMIRMQALLAKNGYVAAGNTDNPNYTFATVFDGNRDFSSRGLVMSQGSQATPSTIAPAISDSTINAAFSTREITWGTGPNSMQYPLQSADLGETVSYRISAKDLFGPNNRVKISLYEASGAFTVDVSDRPGCFGSTAKTSGIDARFPDYSYCALTMSDTEYKPLSQYAFSRLGPPDANGDYWINVRANPVPSAPNPATYFLFYTNA